MMVYFCKILLSGGRVSYTTSSLPCSRVATNAFDISCEEYELATGKKVCPTPAEFDIIHFSVGETSSAGKGNIEVKKDSTVYFKFTIQNIGQLSGIKEIGVYDGSTLIWSDILELGPSEIKNFSLLDIPSTAGTHQYCAKSTS